MIVKVCGLRQADNIREVAALGVDYIGLIFWDKSPRYAGTTPSGVIPDACGSTPCFLPRKVGVFVNPTAQEVIARVASFGLDVVQLHGHETTALIRELRHALPEVQIWKAVSVVGRDSVAAFRLYADYVDAFVFDTKCKTVGGSGEQFDWRVLEAYDGDVPFLLSGGIGPDDAERIHAFHHPKCLGIDLNSRFEKSPGIKDIVVLSQFLYNL